VLDRKPCSYLVIWQHLSGAPLESRHGLSQVNLEEHINEWVSVVDVERAHRLWGFDGADRAARLALKYPELLTHEE
jgi:hypothetical protein